MVKKVAYIVVGIFGLVLAWMVASVLTERGVQEPSYALEKAMDGYEIRRYKPYLVAEVEVPASTEDPLGVGFRTLFKYIDGANKGRRKIDMTSPVLRQESKAEKIPMTKPVFGRKEQGATKVGFVLPEGFTLETAPLPENQDIRIRETPARRVAVIIFSGYATNTLIDEKRKELISLLDRDGLQPVGASLMAYYNPPWTPPFMRRNEVMFAIE